MTLGGYKDHHAPADEKGFLEHARISLHRSCTGAASRRAAIRFCDPRLAVKSSS